MDKIALGKLGEQMAVDYLKKKDYKILECNFKCKSGEIDIIAKYKDVLVFVEVKTRTTIKYGMPKEAVNYRKQQKIRNVALVYLKFKRLMNSSCRFDVIEVLGGSITHLENCF